MEATSTNNNLKVEVTNKQILKIALPICIAILIPQINMLTNNIFLGNLSTQALGNAGITAVFYLIFAVAGNGLNNALISVCSKYAGSDNTSAFQNILSQGVRIALQFAFVGILITWFATPFILKPFADANAYPSEISFLKIRILGLPFLYLFQMGNGFLVATLNSKYLMIGFVCETVVNILFDYLLINGHFGFTKMGFNGAAVASVIAEVVGCLVVFLVLLKSGLIKKYSLFKNFTYHKKISKEIVKLSAPLMMQYIISVTTWLIFFILIEALHDPTTKAISNTLRNVFGLIGIFVWAFANTSNTMISNLMGQHKEDKVLLALNKITFWSFSFCLIMCVLVNIFPHIFFGIFGQGEYFVTQAIPVLRITSVGLLVMSFSAIWLNGITGTGKTRVNLAIEIGAISVYLIYTWYFTKYHFISLAMAWSNEIIYWGITFILSFLYLRSGKWKTPKLLYKKSF